MSTASSVIDSNCPVASPSIDLVPEVFHSLGRCLCFTCTCGHHKCPSQTLHTYSKAIYTTSYKQSFTRPSLSNPPKRVQPTYQPSPGKMDLISSYKKEFVPKKTTAEKPSRPKTPQPTYKFEASTKYAQDFPNWGSTEYYHNKQPHPPVYEALLAFQGQSSYKAFFGQKKEPSSHFKVVHAEEYKKGLYQAPYESTSRREYRENPREYMIKNRRQPAHEPFSVFYNPNAFKSTAKTDFSPCPPQKKDPSVYRKELLSKDQHRKNFSFTNKTPSNL
jgi:hypothetical protein